MKECQYKIYNDIQKAFNQDLHNVKTRVLIALSYFVLSGYKNQIDFFVKKAISYGASRRDFLKVISCIIGDTNLLNSIIEFFKIIDINLKNEGYK